ncbi:glycosyl hydrolase family 3, partial [Petrotoga sp. 9PW.55.5.1]|uniref:glycoside hydrolase family 3 C-terminal domain-containing protein n=1 Tax=Petrotoga sp. 9PW.55.5.1 TaxID=1308979 RepID=UPI000DC21189
ESIVLLKNKDNVLPIKKEGTIAVIGGFAKNPRYQGGGSSHVNPTKLDNALEEIKKIVQGKAKILYEEGYNTDNDEINNELIEKAKKAAKESEIAVIFAGLPERYESEGYDREHMKMPENHNKLIEEVSKVQPNTIVVLSNGSPVEMPWVDKVKGIIESYLGGQAGGGAVADVLFGEINPSGKLAETFPKKLNHNPSHLNFPGEGNKVEYKEGVFVGYRYYDKKEIEPLFPFGYGLSYTNFEYSDITIDKKEITDQETIKVKVKVKNTGKVKGKEIVQLYIKDVESTLNRPEKELKGFEKIELEPNEEKIVTFTLDKRAFAYYNPEIKDWHVESGEFEILIGKSSKEIVLKEKVKVNSTVKIKKKFHRNSTVGDLMEDPVGVQIMNELIQKLSKVGGMFSEDDHKSNDMVLAMMKYMPLRGLINFGKGEFTEEMLKEILEKVNEER